MARHAFCFVPVFLVVLSLAVTFSHARYHAQQQDEPSYGYGQFSHNQGPKPHYQGSDLSNLNADELETLLFLLERAKGNNNDAGHYYEKPIPLNLDSAPAKNYYYETRNKRTGHPQKKVIDWEDYFGIDKKKRSPIPQRTYVSRPNSVVGTLHKSPPSQAHEAATTKAPAPVITTTKTEHEHSTPPDAETEKEKEEQIREFYKNMAFAMNMRRRKRDVSNAIAVHKTQAAVVAPQVIIPRVMDGTLPTTTIAAAPIVKDTPEIQPVEKVDAEPSNEAQAAAHNTSENENVFLAVTSGSTLAATTPRVAAAAPVPPADMSRGDLEKLKAKLIKQINAAYSIEQLRQVLRDGSAAN